MATQTRNPTSDDAVSGTWTGSAGTRYTVVDDYPDTTGADELTHGTTAGNLTFGFSAFSLPSGVVVDSVQVQYYDYKNGSQGCTIGGRLKVNGSYYNAATHNPANGSANRTQRTDTWTTNPATTSAWTVAEVNGTGGSPLQAFGWVSTDASPTITLSSIRVVVNYTDPNVTVGLTGEASSSALGTLTPVPEIPTLGHEQTASAGTVLPSSDAAQTGSQVDGLLGAFAPDHAVPALGDASASATGSVTTDSNLAITGLSSTGAQGDVTALSDEGGDRSADLVGQASVATPGLVESYNGTPLLGTASEMAPGDLQPTVALSGLALTSTAGDVCSHGGTYVTGESGIIRKARYYGPLVRQHVRYGRRR